MNSGEYGQEDGRSSRQLRSHRVGRESVERFSHLGTGALVGFILFINSISIIREPSRISGETKCA